jgi:hypothetical protein
VQTPVRVNPFHTTCVAQADTNLEVYLSSETCAYLNPTSCCSCDSYTDQAHKKLLLELEDMHKAQVHHSQRL